MLYAWGGYGVPGLHARRGPTSPILRQAQEVVGGGDGVPGLHFRRGPTNPILRQAKEVGGVGDCLPSLHKLDCLWLALEGYDVKEAWCQSAKNSSNLLVYLTIVCDIVLNQTKFQT